MNELIQKLAMDCHLMNYVDLETPRHYFVHADIGEEDIEMFALQCVRTAVRILETKMVNQQDLSNNPVWNIAVMDVEREFGLGE